MEKEYQRNIRFQESSWPCGRLRAKRRIALAVSRWVYLLSALVTMKKDTWIDDVLLSIFLVFFDVTGKRYRVVDAILSDLLVDLRWVRKNLLRLLRSEWASRHRL